MREAYLSFLTRRALAPAVVLVIFLLAGLVTFLGEWCARSEALCFSNKSPIFALRRATGIRFTRRSIRARRSWVCRAYWARSLRARSVTVQLLVCGTGDSRFLGGTVLSSCRLSIRACFCLRVNRIFFLDGLPVGVCIPSLGYASSVSEDLRFSVEEAMKIRAVGDNPCRISQNIFKMERNSSCGVE